jgi:hypothetical protein
VPRPDPPARVRALLAAYRETHYDVAMPDGSLATLRVGEATPAAIRAWMQSDAFAVFIGAGNSRSRAVPDADNALRDAALASRLRALPCRTLPGVGHIPGAAWRENAVLVAGLPLAALDALARGFGQNAVVVARLEGQTQLRLYQGDWRALAPADATLTWAG